MNEFHILDHIVIFDKPSKINGTPWTEHIPFAFFLISILKPRTLVELGVYTGESFNAFCQAVKRTNSNTACYGIDTWQGDEHAGFYNETVYDNLSTYIKSEYSSFAYLMKMTFNEALQCFADGSIDLIHIDGLHTYEEVKHDFESWLPKMSTKGVVVFHDTQVKDCNFGVWNLWEEISKAYPSFELKHGYGLGIVAVGKEVDRAFLNFLHDNRKNVYERLFFFLGNSLLLQLALEKLQSELAQKIQTIELTQNELQQKNQLLDNIQRSRSWKILQFLRKIKSVLRGKLRNGISQ